MNATQTDTIMKEKQLCKLKK